MTTLPVGYGPVVTTRAKVLPLVDLEAQYAEIGAEVEAAVLRICRSLRYVGGEEVDAFERAFAAHTGAAHAVGVANGTDALELALVAAGLEPGDEVLIPANTFVATAEAVHAAGGAVRFSDVHSESGLIDLESAAERVTPATRAIVPVHLYGRMVEMDSLSAFARRHHLLVIEDAAQAHNARRNGSAAGTSGDAGCFSFYPGKNLGAIGDAGAVVTNDAGIAERLRLLRDHGRDGHGNHAVIGRNSRLDPLQAAVLSVKLGHLDRWTQARRAAATALREHLDPTVLDWTGGGDPCAEVHHLFPILAADRDAMEAGLRERGIMTGVHYRHDLPSTPAFAGGSVACPVAASRARHQLSLPMHPHLDDAAIEQIAEGVAACLATQGPLSG